MTARELVSVGTIGLRARPLRAALSALGIAIGISAIVAGLGISASSQADLLAQIDALGTNLLTVSPDATFGGGTATLPAAAPAMIARIGPVTSDAATAQLSDNVYRNQHIPDAFVPFGCAAHPGRPADQERYDEADHAE